MLELVYFTKGFKKFLQWYNNIKTNQFHLFLNNFFKIMCAQSPTFAVWKHCKIMCHTALLELSVEICTFLSEESVLLAPVLYWRNDEKFYIPADHPVRELISRLGWLVHDLENCATVVLRRASNDERVFFCRSGMFPGLSERPLMSA